MARNHNISTYQATAGKHQQIRHAYRHRCVRFMLHSDLKDFKNTDACNNHNRLYQLRTDKPKQKQPKPETLNPKPPTLNPKPETLNPKT